MCSVLCKATWVAVADQGVDQRDEVGSAPDVVVAGGYHRVRRHGRREGVVGEVRAAGGFSVTLAPTGWFTGRAGAGEERG